ncbi:methyl-accepting chemotaxis protein [Bradyrhizobium sp.]|uniref:methyl-accepting chemotaxis protein n=1 Tax=Bradyrhizobium sp. TaxID=376 RepID=UPI00271E2A6D|nr:methyl-accepting chemotaxis protein [Bradyrhizobium sp.]MDO9299360.1 methyl-accepting chemotaxis protein [Bradyrhizobium sp.]
MNLKIRTILPLIISALAIMAVASAGFAAYEAYVRRQDAEAFLKINQISQRLLQSAGQWAVERGMTNAPLKSPDALPAERRAEIVKIRTVADQAFREAAQQLRAVPAMKAAEKEIAEAEGAFRAFEAFRSRVDDNLAKPGSGRTSEVVEGFAPAITSLIEVAANKLRLTLETLTSPPTVGLTQLVGLRHLTAQMAENAGRERAFFGGIVGAHSKLTMERIRIVARTRGQVELAWETIRASRQRGGIPAKIVDAIASVDKEYFGTYGTVRDAIFAAGETGEYKITGGDYVARATTAINSILQLADSIGKAADEEATNQAAKSTSSLAVNGAILLASIGLVLLSFWIAFSRILRPLFALTGAMGELANGNFSVVLPGLGRKDEIGDMAQAVEGFKVKAEEKARAEAEAKIKQDQVAAQQRKADMIKLADDFEGAVGEIIETVSSASTELEASAGTLTSTAERSQELTTMVAAASEEASTNVQSVASATEELSSSVNEISRQVQESSRMASEAVNQARTTNDRVGELSKAAARIGDVVELINTIAGQTNLLALNATIEAARAGEAGRGFAVVASEVKALAEQTAKATGEIGQQITGIQAATQDSVTAIKEISGTIEKLSEISSTIAAAVEEQGAATQEISRNVQQAAQGTQQVSSNIMDVQRGASETGSASSQVLSAAQSLSGDSNRLKLEVGKFLSSVRAA